MSTIKLTNGAAFHGLAILNNGKTGLEDLFVSGSIAVKLKPAKFPPDPNDDEKVGPYQRRVEDWLEADMGEIELSETEREFLRGLLKKLGSSNELPRNIHVATLCAAVGLDKP